MHIDSPDAMIDFGRAMASKATHILLYGDLGAGKTHFVKGYVEALGIDPYIVQSPTYTYFHDYEGKVLHMDMYRLEEYTYFVEKGMLQTIQEYERVLIERPKFTDVYAQGYTRIFIEKTTPTTRTVVIE